MSERHIEYQRCAFTTRLSMDRLYTESHTWLSRLDGSLWRVGFTEFATRVLGEPVEFDFEVEAGAQVEAGQVIGWIEGFKAISDLFSPLAGRFQEVNPELDDDINLIHADPYGRGWMYLIEGSPGDDRFDVHEYASVLDSTIDATAGGQHGPK